MSQVATDRVVEGIQLPPVGVWQFDRAHTTVEFVARHMLSRVRGRFTEFDGQIVVGERPEDSSVEVAVETGSVWSDQDMRDNHLRSTDFFQSETYPTMTFRSTAVRPAGGNALDIDGELTIRDVTRPITLHAELLGWGPGMNDRTMMAFSASTEVDREDWGLTWNMAVETGGFLVSKKAQIEILVEALLVENE